MAIQDIFDASIVDLQMEAKTKDEAIRHLSAKLLEAGYISDLEEFVADIYVREAEGITGMGSHIAIPHGKSESVQRIGIAIGRSKYDIPWESYDDEPVRIVFLFSVPFTDNYANEHLRLLAELSRRLGRDEVVAQLQTVESFEALVAAFE